MEGRVRRHLPELCKKLNPHFLFTSLAHVLNDADAEMIDKRLSKSTDPDADLVFFIYQMLKRCRPTDWVIHFLQVLRDCQEFELLHKLGVSVSQTETPPSRQRWEVQNQHFALAQPSSHHAVPWSTSFCNGALSPPSGQCNSLHDSYSPCATSLSSPPPSDPGKATGRSGAGGHPATGPSSSFCPGADMAGRAGSSHCGGPVPQQPGITINDLVDNASCGYPLGATPQQTARGPPVSGGERQTGGTLAPESFTRPEQPDPDAVVYGSNSTGFCSGAASHDLASNQQTPIRGDLTPNIRPSLDYNLDSGPVSANVYRKVQEKSTEINKLGSSSPREKQNNVILPLDRSRSTDEQLQTDAEHTAEYIQAEQLEGLVPEGAAGRRSAERVQRRAPPSFESSARSCFIPPQSSASPVTVNIGKLIVSGPGNYVAFGGQGLVKSVFEGTGGATAERAEGPRPSALGEHAPPPAPPSDGQHETRLKRTGMRQAGSEDTYPLRSGSNSPSRQDFRQQGFDDLRLPLHSRVPDDLSCAHVSGDASTHHRTYRKAAWPDDRSITAHPGSGQTQLKVEVLGVRASQVGGRRAEGRRLAGEDAGDEKGSYDEKSPEEKKGSRDEKSPRLDEKSPRLDEKNPRLDEKSPSNEKCSYGEKSPRDEKGSCDEKSHEDENGSRDEEGPYTEKGSYDEKNAELETGSHDEKSPRLDDKGAYAEKGCHDKKGTYTEKGTYAEKDSHDERGRNAGEDAWSRGFQTADSFPSTVSPTHGPLWTRAQRPELPSGVSREGSDPSHQYRSPPGLHSQAFTEEAGNLPTTLNEAVDWSSQFPLSPADPAHVTVVKTFCAGET